jgi:hypothetical protein
VPAKVSCHVPTATCKLPLVPQERSVIMRAELMESGRVSPRYAPTLHTGPLATTCAKSAGVSVICRAD